MKFLVMSALSKNPCTAHFLILGGLSIFGLQNGRKKDVSSFATIKAKNVVFVVRICMGTELCHRCIGTMPTSEEGHDCDAFGIKTIPSSL